MLTPYVRTRQGEEEYEEEYEEEEEEEEEEDSTNNLQCMLPFSACGPSV